LKAGTLLHSKESSDEELPELLPSPNRLVQNISLKMGVTGDQQIEAGNLDINNVSLFFNAN